LALLRGRFFAAALAFAASTISFGMIRVSANNPLPPYACLAPLSFSTCTRTARSTGVGCHWMGQ